MAVFTLTAGAEVDIATGDELTGATKKLMGKIDSSWPKPIRFAVAGSSPAGQATIDFGRPPVGKIWRLVFVTTLSSVDSFTTVASGLISIFFGDEANPGLLQCRLPALPIPSWNKTDGGLWVHSTERLFGLCNAQATAAAIVAVCEIEEFTESEVTATFNRYSSM